MEKEKDEVNVWPKLNSMERVGFELETFLRPNSRNPLSPSNLCLMCILSIYGLTLGVNSELNIWQTHMAFIHMEKRETPFFRNPFFSMGVLR